MYAERRKDRSPAEKPQRLTRAQSRERTRLALLEAAAAEFIERGFAGASVEAISHRAGYTRGAFYSNFSSKEELFAELLQERVFAGYRSMAREGVSAGRWRSPRAVGERLAELLGEPEGRWLWGLWLEVLAHAARDEMVRRLAADFWRGTRELSARVVREAHREAGTTPPAPPDRIATALIALDIGLAVQHMVDPEAVPLDVYPELYELLFGRLPRRTA